MIQWLRPQVRVVHVQAINSRFGHRAILQDFFGQVYIDDTLTVELVKDTQSHSCSLVGSPREVRVCCWAHGSLLGIQIDFGHALGHAMLLFDMPLFSFEVVRLKGMVGAPDSTNLHGNGDQSVRHRLQVLKTNRRKQPV